MKQLIMSHVTNMSNVTYLSHQYQFILRFSLFLLGMAFAS